jgi:hypothetical protein
VGASRAGRAAAGVDGRPASPHSGGARAGRPALAAVAALAGVVVVAAAALAGAQAAAPPLRIALLSQWVVSQYAAASPDLAGALAGGVVDGTVFAWQRGRISRAALVGKPIRALAGAEAAALDGRGEFQVIAVRAPLGPAAWTEVDVWPRTARPGDVLVLEVGGELNTVSQVLARLLVGAGNGRLEERPLARRALFPSPGVPVVRVPFGQPVTLSRAVAFPGGPSLDFLVARSPIETIVNGTVTPSGPADVSPIQGGEWREGDRVLIRVPLATLQAGAPPVVLAWKDRVPLSDPDRRRRVEPIGP